MGWSGAGGGAAKALTQILEERRLKEIMQSQAQQQAIENTRAQERMGLERQQFDALETDRAADRTYREGQVSRQAKLDDREDADRRQDGNARGVKMMVGELVRREGVTPQNRKQIMGMLTEIGAVPTTELLRDPTEELTDYEAKRKIDARYRQPPATSDDLVKVDTMENGKRVTKWLPKSQVAGKTFESPSGGPTLASGVQRKNLNYYNRMNDALGTIEGIEPTIAGQGVAGKLQGQYAPNFAQTSDQQSYRQAQRAFTEARLRKESGAAIPPHEYENDAVTYFAQPGDSPSTIAQKRQKRQALLESTAFEAGPAYEEFYGEPFKRTAPKTDTPRDTAGGGGGRAGGAGPRGGGPPQAPPGWRYVPKPGGGWTAVEDK